MLLQGLYGLNMLQLAKGVPGINDALISGRLRYIRLDKNEEWQPIRTIWERGGGDCEDLAAAVAAELALQGIPAHPVIYRSGPHMAHAVVQLDAPKVVTVTGMHLFGHPVIAPGIIDPSRTGGM